MKKIIGRRIPVVRRKGKIVVFCAMVGVYRKVPISECSECDNLVKVEVGAIWCRCRSAKD